MSLILLPDKFHSMRRRVLSALTVAGVSVAIGCIILFVCVGLAALMEIGPGTWCASAEKIKTLLDANNVSTVREWLHRQRSRAPYTLPFGAADPREPAECFRLHTTYKVVSICLGLVMLIGCVAGAVGSALTEQTAHVELEL